jgi:antitoxin CptB
MQNTVNEDFDYRIKKLIYQSNHRGCKELDIILGSFANAHLTKLNTKQLDLYEAMCLADEWDIYSWILKADNSDNPFNEILLIIQTFITQNEYAK